jgi:outer membrane protein assembly factor BamB
VKNRLLLKFQILNFNDMRFQLSLFAILFLFFNSISQEIVQWRGPNRNGIFPDKELLKSWPADGPELLWTADGLGDGYSSAVVSEDAIFVSGAIEDKGYIIALDHNGKELWRSFYGNEWIESYEGARTTPLLYDEKLYMVSGMGKIICMNPQNGTIIWEVDLIEKYGAINLKWGMTENPAFLENMIYITPGGKVHNILALDKDTGKIIWTSRATGEISAYCSPLVVNHNGMDMLITQTEKSILGINARTGGFLWSHPQPNRWSVHANTPYYTDGRVYCVSGYGQGGVALKIAPDGLSASELWRDTNLDGRMGSFIVLDGYIYGPADQGLKWFGLKWENGEKVFEQNMIKKGNITAADGMLYLYGEDGKVMLARPENGQIIEVSQFRLNNGSGQHWAFPVIKNQKLYLRRGNALMVYNIAAQ